MLYRAGGTFRVRGFLFPRGGMRGLGKGSGMLACSPEDIQESLEAFESERLCSKRTAWPIFISRGISALDICWSFVCFVMQCKKSVQVGKICMLFQEVKGITTLVLEL